MDKPNSSDKPEFRPLKREERAVRRKCPRCGDYHAAVINPADYTLQCRVCDMVFQPLQGPKL